MSDTVVDALGIGAAVLIVVPLATRCSRCCDRG